MRRKSGTQALEKLGRNEGIYVSLLGTAAVVSDGINIENNE